MALGGGTFTVQNKVLPGAYINFVSAANASSTLSDRGVAAIGVAVGWNFSDDILEVSAADFQKNTMEIFGLNYGDEKLRYLREVFLNASSVLVYPIDSGENSKRASSEIATAKYAGSLGNQIKITVTKNEDEFTVTTVVGGVKADEQTVKNSSELCDNDFVLFNREAALQAASSVTLTGGSDGGEDIISHQKFLDKLENYSFNTVGCLSDDEQIKKLYTAFCKRMRDDVGKKFQCVVYNYAADHEGIINVKNPCSSGLESGLVAWVTGVCAGLAVNKSALNKKYDGELDIYSDYKQSALEDAVNSGEFTLHRVGSELRVLMDINSLVTLSDERGELFRENQTVRVIDQIGNDIAVLFATKYLGNVPNDAAGRVSLWNDIVQHHKQLQDIRAIENFSDTDVVVEQGNSKKSVVVSDVISVVNAMAKLYMTVTIS